MAKASKEKMLEDKMMSAKEKREMKKEEAMMKMRKMVAKKGC